MKILDRIIIISEFIVAFLDFFCCFRCLSQGDILFSCIWGIMAIMWFGTGIHDEKSKKW